MACYCTGVAVDIITVDIFTVLVPGFSLQVLVVLVPDVAGASQSTGGATGQGLISV